MLTVTLSVAAFALSASAIPLAPRQDTFQWPKGFKERHDWCPAGFHQYRIPGACTYTGFIGCANPGDAPNISDGYCGGPAEGAWVKKCPEGYGEYHECPENNFVGCSTDPDVCKLPGRDWVPEADEPIHGISRPDLCPTGTTYQGIGDCKTQFIGCLPDGAYVADCQGPLQPGEDAEDAKFFFRTCVGRYGTFQACNNGFFGCSVEDACAKAPPYFNGDGTANDGKTPAGPGPDGKNPEPPKKPQPPNDKSKAIEMEYCPAGTTYYLRDDCSSGFIGCGTSAVCSGEEVWWGHCPSNTGTFYLCARTGFEGCTTQFMPAPC